jgi:hypothetical protein
MFEKYLEFIETAAVRRDPRRATIASTRLHVGAVVQ